MVFYLLFSSVTYAFEAKDAFSKYGIPAKIERAKESMASCPCNYSAEIRDIDRNRLMNIIQNEKIEYSGLYYEVNPGRYEQVKT